MSISGTGGDRHSSASYPHWMSALLDLYDCLPGDETALRGLTSNVLTIGFLRIAADSFEGSLVTTHGRIYAPMLKVPDLDGCSGLHWLLYRDGHLTEPTAVVPMAAGGYRPPRLFSDIAEARGATLTRHRRARRVAVRTKGSGVPRAVV